MKLIQIRFSHNCVKVRRALELKGLDYDVAEINPMDRNGVFEASRQRLVPVLVDGDRTVHDSTAILLYLDERHPDPPLLPADPAARAECLVLEDWADEAFMARTRRVAYWTVLETPGRLEQMFFPTAPRWKRALMARAARRAVARRFGLTSRRIAADLRDLSRLARLAVDRLDGRAFLVGDRISVADIALAAMAAPLWAGPQALLAEPAVRSLAEWSSRTLGDELGSLYRKGPDHPV